MLTQRSVISKKVVLLRQSHQQISFCALFSELFSEPKTKVFSPPGNASWVTSVSVMVVDQFGLTDTATVQVTITDINDNAPTFGQEMYSATVSGKGFNERQV